MIALMLPQPGGRFTATNTPLRMLVMAAFELQQEAQLAGGPPDLLPTKYDITARAPVAFIGAKELPQLLRTLLADRFKLKSHTETRDLPVYDLMLARDDGRLGRDMRPSKSDCSKPDEIAPQQGAGPRAAGGKHRSALHFRDQRKDPQAIHQVPGVPSLVERGVEEHVARIAGAEPPQESRHRVGSDDPCREHQEGERHHRAGRAHRGDFVWLEGPH
jgi:uncharacterized protein (TIGR03435 family)